ncbi:hypothetical protein LOK82_09815 [Xylella fastidiosa subsp. multiplex]|uniref:Uncharacterized protein n=1 Tax=Xylella fastidiosa subsp. multiplex TaxID=644357 RepID=A0AAW6HVX9_XYLFS|nr:hypothetical protein [Xylella fastidiosa subsp. multiplex]
MANRCLPSNTTDTAAFPGKAALGLGRPRTDVESALTCIRGGLTSTAKSSWNKAATPGRLSRNRPRLKEMQASGIPTTTSSTAVWRRPHCRQHTPTEKEPPTMTQPLR